MAAHLSRRAFRLYASQDMIGVQLSGALKNVLAIAAGNRHRRGGWGESARAALIARGLAELTRFVIASGGLPETAAGLSGLGDLVLTATSEQSRNYRFGQALGKGERLDTLLGPDLPLVEGAGAAPDFRPCGQGAGRADAGYRSGCRHCQRPHRCQIGGGSAAFAAIAH